MPRLNWDKCSLLSINNYTKETDTCLSSLHLPLDATRCKNIKCNNVDHVAELETYYINLNLSLMDIFERLLEHQHYTQMSHKIIPGWNKYVRSSHDAAREAFHLWHQFGCPRNGPVAALMSRTRSVYKYCLRTCKKLETQSRADNMAKTLLNEGSSKSFWNNVKKLSTSKIPLPNS